MLEVKFKLNSCRRNNWLGILTLLSYESLNIKRTERNEEGVPEEEMLV